MRFCLTLGLLSLCLLTTPAHAQFNYITKGSSPNLIIFVHGFMGSPTTTFDAKLAKGWPQLISKDDEKARFGPPLSSYGVGVVEYPTGVFERLRLEDIAERVRTDLSDAGVFHDYRNIHIIAHSMGGLVVKRMFNIVFARNQREREAIKSIFLISVPSQGADAADVLKRIPFFGPQFKDLGRIEANNYLNALENDWQRNFRERTTSFPRVYCAYERKPLAGFYTPVPQAFAATSCDNTPRAENEDHFTIVTPKSRRASIYRWVRGRIIETNEKLPQVDLGRNAVGSYEEQLKDGLAADNAEEIFAHIEDGLTSKTASHRRLALRAWFIRNPEFTIKFDLPDWLWKQVKEAQRIPNKRDRDYALRRNVAAGGLRKMYDETGATLTFQHNLNELTQNHSTIWSIGRGRDDDYSGSFKFTAHGVRTNLRLAVGTRAKCSFDMKLSGKQLKGKASCLKQSGYVGYVPFPVSIQLD